MGFSLETRKCKICQVFVYRKICGKFCKIWRGVVVLGGGGGGVAGVVDVFDLVEKIKVEILVQKFKKNYTSLEKTWSP